MGSAYQKSEFEKNNWSLVEQKNHKTILYNDATSKSIEKHQAVISFEYDHITQIYAWRQTLQPSSPVLEVYEFGIKQTGLCNAQAEIYAITERVHLFDDLFQISQPEGFLILRDVIRGLQILFKQFGFFIPYGRLFGINNEGKLKIWVNENFALCEPASEKVPPENSQLIIVNNLIRAISAKIAHEEGLNFVNYPYNFNFQEALDYLTNSMAKVEGFQIDKVFLNRQEYSKSRHHVIERFELQAKSRLIMLETEKKLIQIETLKAILKQKQLDIAQKELVLSNQKNVSQPPFQIPQAPSHPYNFQRKNEIIHQNSQQILKHTASTNKSFQNSPRFGPLQQYPKVQKKSNQKLYSHFPPFPQKIKTKTSMEERIYPTAMEDSQMSHESLKKEIEMVDSMILVEEDNVEEKNKIYIESRVINPQNRQYSHEYMERR